MNTEKCSGLAAKSSTPILDRRVFVLGSATIGLGCLASCLLGCSEERNLSDDVVGSWQNTSVWETDGDESYGYYKGESYTTTFELFEGGTGNLSCVRDGTGEELKGWLIEWEIKDDVVNITVPSMIGSYTYGYKLSSDGSQLISVRDSEDAYDRVQ